MDPEATLRELRTLGAKLIQVYDSLESDGKDNIKDRDLDACRFVELFQALDEWRINGGFLPEVWRKP